MEPSFTVLTGDLFTSEAQTLVNAVNCVGVMGKGIALEFKKRFPEMFADYARRCKRGQVKLGEPYLFRGGNGKQVLNFPTKGDWRSSSRLEDIELGLVYFADHFAEWGITTIAFPALGCGNGGLDWPEVGSLMYRTLRGLPAEIEVYPPPGTRPSELTQEFLSRSHA